MTKFGPCDFDGVTGIYRKIVFKSSFQEQKYATICWGNMQAFWKG